MTFGSVFGRTFSPTFQPSSQAAAVAGGGWWDLNGTITSCVGAWQAKGAASYAASKVNLTGNATYDLAEIGGGAVNWDAAVGWSGFATLSRCLDTTVPDIMYNWTLIARFSDVTANSTVIIGGYDNASDSAYISYKSTGDAVALMCSEKSISSPTSTGVLAIAGIDFYRNGTDAGNLNAQNTTNKLARTPYIGALHYTAAQQYIDGKVQAAAFYNATLTPTQVGNLTTAMAAL